MKKITEIAVGLLGLYLIINSLSILARSSWGVSSSADFHDYVLMFGPSVILATSGIVFLLFRIYISGWLLKWQDFDIPEHIDLNRIESIILSLLGILVLFEIIPYFTISVNNFFISPEVQKTDYGDLPIRSYAFVQVIAQGIELLLSLALIFIPKKIQNSLSKIRGF